MGQSLPAVVSHVDLDKGRVFLSFRNATPHPLQQTLETLLSVTSSGSAVAAAGAAGATGAAAAASGAAEPLADLRAALGDMAEAVRFCEALRGVEGVRDAQPGVRLQSRASSQALEVRGGRYCVGWGGAVWGVGCAGWRAGRRGERGSGYQGGVGLQLGGRAGQDRSRWYTVEGGPWVSRAKG